ncbi:hypothetical protein LguiA_026509 [Lonicera macranthoides]
MFKNSTATRVFGRASTQGSPNSNEERDMGGGQSMFAMGDGNVRSSGEKGRSSKRTMTSLDMLLEKMSETSRAKIVHYDTKATYVDEHTMADCMTVLSNMPMSRVRYAFTVEKLISGKDWLTFFLLSSRTGNLNGLMALSRLVFKTLPVLSF